MAGVDIGASAASRPLVAVVLAGDDDDPGWPLVRVHGTHVLERAILALAVAGVERVIVVAGAGARAGARALDRVLRRPRLRGLQVERVHGVTGAHGLAEGATRAGAAFYLVTADRVFEPGIALALAAAHEASPEDVLVATDAAGGGTERREVGVRLCPAWMGARAEAAVAAGARTVDDVVDAAHGDGRVRAVPIDGRLWQPVDTAAGRAAAERRLVEATRKPTDGPVARWLNRPISLAVTRVLARFDVRPNAMTTLVFLLGVGAAGAIVTATPGALVAAALVTQLASVLDGCDGELARVNLRGSRFGAWYDTITDNLRYSLMVVAAGIALHRRTGSDLALVATVVFVLAAGYLVVRMVRHLRRDGANGTHLVILARVEATPAASRSRLGALLFRVRVLVKQDVLALLAAVALAAQLPGVVLGGGLLAVAGMIVVVEHALAEAGRAARGGRLLFGLVGTGLLAWLLADAPFAEIATAVRRMGPAVLLAAPIVLLWSLANTFGLHRLLGGRVSVGRLFVTRVVGDGYNAIIPAAGVGGEPVRIAILRGELPVADAAAAIITDRVVNIVASLLVSAVAFVVAAAAIALPASIAHGMLGYALVAVPVALAAVLVLVRGSAGSLAARVARRLDRDAALTAAPPAAIVIALAWHVVGRVLAVLEVALYTSLLGLSLSPIELLLVTGTLHAIGAVGFMIPQGLGIAELGAVQVFQLLGHDPALGLAFGLVRRARVLAFSAVGVFVHAASARRARR